MQKSDYQYSDTKIGKNVFSKEFFFLKKVFDWAIEE